MSGKSIVDQILKSGRIFPKEFGTASKDISIDHKNMLREMARMMAEELGPLADVKPNKAAEGAINSMGFGSGRSYFKDIPEAREYVRYISNGKGLGIQNAYNVTFLPTGSDKEEIFTAITSTPDMARKIAKRDAKANGVKVPAAVSAYNVTDFVGPLPEKYHSNIPWEVMRDKARSLYLWNNYLRRGKNGESELQNKWRNSWNQIGPLADDNAGDLAYRMNQIQDQLQFLKKTGIYDDNYILMNALDIADAPRGAYDKYIVDRARKLINGED